MSVVRIGSFGPVRPWVYPGSELVVALAASVDEPMTARAQLSLLDEERMCGLTTADLDLGPAPSPLELRLTVPETPRHGYGLRLRLDTADGASAVATCAVEVLEGWWQSPRHAAVTGYRDAHEAAGSTCDLVSWHVNVVQHYDWMWRHYRYRPPDGASVFEDALGRTVSHDALRASIAAGHAGGIAALAYGAVYGAEPEHVERHPDDRVFDSSGEPLSLGGTFYLNDVRPGAAWRERLLGEYEAAVSEFGFDGIHMDTYGPPHTALAADGEALDFAELYPGLIEEAAARLTDHVPGTRVLFNCVEGFPLESVAPAPAAALYLELWPPDDSFADIVRWVDRARALADGRAVVIAAYAATLKEPVDYAERQAAFEVVPMLGAVIAAAGAYHHTLAEGDRLLVEGYYPAAVPMTPTEVDELRALWRFTARYVHLLSDPGLAAVEPAGLVLRDDHGEVPWSADPVAGSVWLRATRTPDDRRLLHLVDLRDQVDADWTTPKAPTRATVGLQLEWPGAAAAVAMSPWTEQGQTIALAVNDGSALLPSFRRWLVLAER